VIELVQESAVQKFSQSAGANGLVASGILGVSTEDFGLLRWVFQGSDDDRPFRDPKGTGKCAVVLTTNSTWGTNQHNTARMPVLTALIYADPTRGNDGTPAKPDAKSKALKVADALITVFHDAANSDHNWPKGLKVHSSVHSDGPNSQPIPDSDGMVRMSLSFQLMVD
jgi:hypothetical protein